jgi:hypothetical protein
MKKKIITLSLLAMLVVFSGVLSDNLGWVSLVSGQDSNPTMEPPGTTVRLSTFAFLPAEGRSDIAAWADLGVQFLSDPQALYDGVRVGKGTLVYVNPEGLTLLDEVWMKAMYRSGVAFAGVDVPLSELAAKVGAMPAPEVPDLDMRYGEGKVQLSLCFEDALIDNRTFYTDFWSDARPAPLIIERPIVYAVQRP